MHGYGVHRITPWRQKCKTAEAILRQIDAIKIALVQNYSKLINEILQQYDNQTGKRRPGS